MAEVHFLKPNHVKQEYAPRITLQQWERHEATIRAMHDQGKNRKDMLKDLFDKHWFSPTLTQLNAHMRKWSLRVYTANRPPIKSSGYSSYVRPDLIAFPGLNVAADALHGHDNVSDMESPTSTVIFIG
jgi:hypothetical protein